MPEPTSGMGKPASKNKNFKKEYTKLAIGVATGAVLGVGLTLLAGHINKNYIANYNTLDDVRATVQKGIPTYCEFEFVGGENGYEGDNMTNVIALDSAGHFYLNHAKRHNGDDIIMDYYNLLRDDYSYMRIAEGSYDDSRKNKQLDEGFIAIYAKTFLDEGSSSYDLRTADSFSCRETKDDDFLLIENVTFEEAPRADEQDGEGGMI